MKNNHHTEKPTTKPPETLTDIESEKLLAYIAKNHYSQKGHRKTIRNSLMTLLMLDAGLRSGEVVKLTLNCLMISNQPTDAVLVSETIAKNNRRRIIPMSPRLKGAIYACLETLWTPDCVMPVDNCFYNSNPQHPLSQRQLQRIVLAASHVSIGRHIHPHVLRHTFATRLMRHTNARIVQELLGHANLASTQIYTHPNQEDLTNAINGLTESKTDVPATE